MELGELTEERKKTIDSMTHYDMCYVWRFTGSADWRIIGACGDYFKDRLFKHFGGFTPEISKSLGF